MNDEVVSPGDGSTHGFLFSYLRGYTHLVDTRGAIEASHLLGRYRAIVREVVTHHGGAEIKTEGDSFYVVLPSASAALRCGLDILRSCTEPADGGEAIQLGIGIHAGESVAHEGGFEGSAINIAARICALATAGQVLVSGTIRELTRSIVSAEFVFVGRRHLKGLDQPVEVFSVTADGATSSVRRRSREAAARLPLRWLAVGLIVMAGIGTGAAFASGWRPIAGPLGAGNSESPAASTSPSGLLQKLPDIGSCNAPAGMSCGTLVDPGTYAPNHNRDVTFVTIPDCCWKMAADWEDLLFFHNASAPANPFGVGVAHITVVYSAGCAGDPTRTIGDRPQDLIDWVQSAPQLDASEPHSVLALGRSGIGIEATVLTPAGACKKDAVWLWGVGGTSWQVAVGTHLLFEALDDGSRTITVFFAASTAQALSYGRGVGRGLIDSIVLRN
jgi:class 3 adenylate cyclase